MFQSRSACGRRGLLILVVWLELSTSLLTAHTVSRPHEIVAAAQISSEQIRQTADQVMRQRDFRAVRRRALENVAESHGDGFLGRSLKKMGSAFADFWEWLFSGIFNRRNRVPPPAPPTTAPAQPATSDSGGIDFSIGKAALFIGLAMLLAIATWIIASVIRSQNGNRRIRGADLLSDTDALGELDVPPGELAASTYESRAIRLASDGNYRLAIRELLIGSMSWIERTGLIRFRKGLTNRNYLRAVWSDERRRTAYHITALQFERIYFGRRSATSEMFEECLQQFQKAFREEETATAES